MLLFLKKVFWRYKKFLLILFLIIPSLHSQNDFKIEILELSRKTLLTYFKIGKIPSFNSILNSQPPRPIFITLVKNGKTRGCAGSFIPIYNSLEESIVNFTVIAATQDIRYPPVKFEELNEIVIKITFPEKPVSVNNPFTINPLTEGLIIKKEGKEGVVLPGEAKTVDYAIKIGLNNSGIKDLNGVSFYKFKGISFSENDFKNIKKENKWKRKK